MSDNQVRSFLFIPKSILLIFKFLSLRLANKGNSVDRNQQKESIVNCMKYVHQGGSDFFKLDLAQRKQHHSCIWAPRTTKKNFRSVALRKTHRRALKIFAKRYIRSKFQSCQIELELKMQSLLTLLISKIPRLSILTHKGGFY